MSDRQETEAQQFRPGFGSGLATGLVISVIIGGLDDAVEFLAQTSIDEFVAGIERWMTTPQISPADMITRGVGVSRVRNRLDAAVRPTEVLTAMQDTDDETVVYHA